MCCLNCVETKLGTSTGMQSYKLTSPSLLKKPSQYTEELAGKNVVLVVGTGLYILISALSEFCQVGLLGFSSLEK